MFKAQCILLVISVVVLGTFGDKKSTNCEKFCQTLVDNTVSFCEEHNCSNHEITEIYDFAAEMGIECAAGCPNCTSDARTCVRQILDSMVNEEVPEVEIDKVVPETGNDKELQKTEVDKDFPETEELDNLFDYINKKINMSKSVASKH
ncbi:hypothetical protein O3M35_003414 [Rhynocoris fuscipes]|uniref:Uncharacterized protein n=1 Tax=Rhynocoris fuscipes TaxID=488301 RepID=A0AAW1CPW1_9HEMI